MADTKSGFSAEERAAMKQRAKELKAEQEGAAGLKAALDAIHEMPEPDREIAQRIHDIVLEVAPQLAPRTYYGFPAYAKDGKIVLFYQPTPKFKTRYGTLAFQDTAALDDGAMWPTAFGITAMDDATAKRIAALVTQAVG